MPKFDLPIEETESNSSLSLSSNENGSMSNQSIGSSISIGPGNPSPPLANERPRSNYNSITTNWQSFCSEPTLDAVLRKVCDTTTDLDKLTNIQMRVSSNVFGLHQMHIFLPNLVALNLDGSSLESLRDLGCDLKLKYLNVSRCGLKSFDGISGFDTVEHLVADGNEISSVIQLSGLEELHTLSLRSNKIKQMNGISFLSLCPKLNNLDLTNNAIVITSDYRQKIKSNLPLLLILDGFGFDETNMNANLTECSSSLSSEFSKDSNYSISDRSSESASRPISTNNQLNVSVANDVYRRSSTIAAEPIVGNIVNKVRRKHRDKTKYKPSDSSSTSLSSLLESTSEKIANSNNFPMILPQSTVPLELGVIDMDPELNKVNSDQDANQLIEMCRRWRELSRKSRQKLDNKSNEKQDQSL